MQARGYAPTFTDPSGLLAGIPEAWHGTWSPTAEALALNSARLAERLAAMAAKRAK